MIWVGNCISIMKEIIQFWGLQQNIKDAETLFQASDGEYNGSQKCFFLFDSTDHVFFLKCITCFSITKQDLVFICSVC